jgi:hypothetical protein
MFLTQIREQQTIIRLETYKIKELKGILETVKIEGDNSSNEEYSKLLEEAKRVPLSRKGYKKKIQIQEEESSEEEVRTL